MGFTAAEADEAEVARDAFERAGGSALAFEAGMLAVARAMQPSLAAMVEMGRAFERLGRGLRAATGDALHRPDGRPRRTGHRHRGTAAWARRWGG